jgi:hypothetical protein
MKATMTGETAIDHAEGLRIIWMMLFEFPFFAA